MLPLLLLLAICWPATAVNAPPSSACYSNLTTLCVMHNVCLHHDAATNHTTLTHYTHARHAMPDDMLVRWRNVSYVQEEGAAFEQAASSARAHFRNVTLFMVMYQMHLPHYFEEELAVLPVYHRWADFGLPSPPARVVNMLWHVSPPGFYRYAYHDAFVSLYAANRSVAAEDPGVLVPDTVGAHAAWDSVWAKHVRAGDVVRETGAASSTSLCFDAIAFNAEGYWFHSPRDADAVRARATKAWGLDFTHDDICILQRRNHRAIANVGDVVTWLHQRTGVRARVFEMDRRPPHAQAALMATCGVLITPHGANEVNMAFMPAGGLVVELIPVSYHYATHYFKAFAKSAGLRSHHVVVPLERLTNDDGCLARYAAHPDQACHDGIGECHWCYKQSNMTLVEADLDGLF